MDKDQEMLEDNLNDGDIKKAESSIPTFKKPILVGKIGRLPRKVVISKNVHEKNSLLEISDNNRQESNESNLNIDSPVSQVKASVQQLPENLAPPPYTEPSWSGLPKSNGKDYTFEVLKSGVIVDQINVMKKPFWIFGRSTNCEICMAHPTISRYHAVLQYRSQGDENDSVGFYIYDLGSTHGTFLNKGRLKSRVYVPVKVGHVLKLGFSSRCFVLTGPEEDSEKESEFTLTELKQQRTEKLLQQELAVKEAFERNERDKEERCKAMEQRGIDWGLGEDADEETDLTENPFAQTNNEELYIDDPKKALRGFMEREGYNFEYICTEQGFGQFLCKVELPLDDDHGRPIVAEVLHKGKKKEAVIQCALEACRILDRYGVLRQAIHESRKRKARNWEENDYYDSDDDTFLDRTGTVEKKREKRMKSKVPQQPETYHSLLEKENGISAEISKIEKQLAINKKTKTQNKLNADEDSLDTFMKELKQPVLDKQTISKLKSDLAVLKTEHVNIVKLINVVKPADLPPLVINTKKVTEQEFDKSKSKVLPIFGKRSKIKVQLPQKSQDDIKHASENETEMEKDAIKSHTVKAVIKPLNTEDIQFQIYTNICSLLNCMMKYNFPSTVNNYIVEIREMLENLKNHVDKELMIEIREKADKCSLPEVADETQYDLIVKNLQRLYFDIEKLVERKHSFYTKIKILGMKVDLICEEMMKETSTSKNKENKANIDQDITKPGSNEEENKDDDESLNLEDLEKRRKKNQKRIQHRKERAELEKQKGYQEDAQREDYNMWVPPGNQTGDGKTSLNEKYGY